MSVLLTKLLHTAARTGQAGIEGYTRMLAAAQAPTVNTNNNKKNKAGCTPCEAMARKARARKIVSG